MSTRLGFVIDLKRCIGCDTCVVGCKMEHGTALGQFRLKVYDPHGNLDTEVPVGTYPELKLWWLPSMCQHCAQAPCVAACPTRALWWRATDGTVVLEKDRCVGCQRCEEECPFDALGFDADRGIADKCDRCEHRTGVGLAPVCVAVCPTRAIHFGDLNDPGSAAGARAMRDDARPLADPRAAEPRIQYLPP